MTDLCTPYIPADYPPRTGFQAYRSTNQSIPNNTVTALTFPTELFDSSTYFTAGGSLATIPAGGGGIYVVGCQVAWASAIASAWVSLATGGVSWAQSAGGNAGALLGWAGAAAPGETFGINVYQNSGGPVDIGIALFQMFKVGL